MAESFQRPPSPPKSPTPDDDLVEKRTLRDYYIILRERFWIAFPLALIVGFAFAYHKSREIPMYESTATMQIEKPERVVTSETVVDTSFRNDIEINTFLQLISSQRVRDRVTASLTPEDIAILQRPFLETLLPGESPPGPGSLVGGISVQSVRNSFMIRITAYNRDPQGAALIANRFVQQIMNDMLENVGGRNEYAVDYLRGRASELGREAAESEQKLLTYMRAHNLVSLDASTNIIRERLTAVNSALQSVRLERIATEDLYRQVDSFRRESKNLLELSFISAHGTVPTVRARLAELVSTQAILGERYLERHPRMIDLANSITVAQNQLTQAVELAIADLEASLAKTRDREASLEREYALHESEQLRLRDLSVEFRNLENASSVAKSNFSQILDRLTQATTSSNLERIPVRPLDPAKPAGSPFSPNLNGITRNAIGLGFVVFFAVAFGLSLLDDRIKSSWDVESFIGTNLLGIIPDLQGVKDADKYRLIIDQKSDPGSESFLGVYSAVKIHSKLDFPKAILVTSTIPGEGKTLISANLAASFSRHGKRTLLVDCDLRRPMLHRHLGLENSAGLLQWHQAGALISPELHQNPDLGIVPINENLHVLRSGGRSKSPTEFLESPAFGELIEGMKRHYDLIIIDSPPMGAVTDALLIADRSDEVLYVCRFNRAYRKHIKLYMRALRSGKNEILGVVLNGLSARRIEYYSNYRYYRSYKKYYGTTA